MGLGQVVPNNNIGYGRVNVCRALKNISGGTMTDCADGTSNLAGFGDFSGKATAFPNPFRVGQHQTVTITIPESLDASITDVRVYTITGDFVKNIDAVGGRAVWDGKNASGASVATGTYIFYVKTTKGHQTGRVAVIR